MEISKELFEEILQEKFLCNDVTGIYCEVDGLRYCVKYSDFFFDCKEWALKHDCELLSCIKSTRAICDIYSNTYNCRFTHYAETEIEAVIKACEWILKEINEKQLQH